MSHFVTNFDYPPPPTLVTSFLNGPLGEPTLRMQENGPEGFFDFSYNIL